MMWELDFNSYGNIIKTEDEVKPLEVTIDVLKFIEIPKPEIL
jgi:hypothetical protein